MPNKLLSILIPTYNRGDFLDFSLKTHIPIIKKYDIQICIFDNGSTDRTKEIAFKWMEAYPHIIYHRHESNIGGIANFEYALNSAQTEYVWLLGDTYEIQSNSLDYIMQKLTHSHQKLDAIVLNLQNKLDISTRNYDDSNLLLQELGAVMTCIAVSIFRKDMIKEDILIRYKKVWFTHMAIIFEDIANRDFFIHWMQEHSILSLTAPTLHKTNWSHTHKALEIGCQDWSNFILSLPPSYMLQNKLDCIMQFGKISGLFKLKNMLLLRIHGILCVDSYRRYRQLFSLTIAYPLPMIWLLSITPRFLLKSLVLIGVTVFTPHKRHSVKKLLVHE